MTDEANSSDTPQGSGFFDAREGQAVPGESVRLSPEEEKARNKRNRAIALGVLGFMALIFMITVLRISQNLAAG